MRSRRTVVFLLLTILILTAPLHRAQAQTGRTYRSVESLIASSEFVAIGSVRAVKKNPANVVSPPNSSGERTKKIGFKYVITTQFDEIVKQYDNSGGDGEFKTLQTEPSPEKIEGIDQLVEKGTVGLWFIEPKYEPEGYRPWKFIPLEGRGVDQFGYAIASLQVPMFGRDLSLLTSQQAIIQRVRDYGPISQKEHDPNEPRVVSMSVPRVLLRGLLPAADALGVSLPLDSQLPGTARQLIESPKDFLSAEEVASAPHALLTGMGDSYAEA